MNLNDYVGLPYREGGRGPDAFDCYGLIAAVYKAARGVSLPDWYQAAPGHPAASRAISAALEGEVHGGRTFKVEQPEDLDIAIVGSTLRPHHVGLWVSGGILHASKPFGSTWATFPQFSLLYPHTEFYRWHT